MYKFRSMRNGAADERQLLNGWNDLCEGPCFKLRNDPRLTPVGRFLRQSSIDELPQLFNVLRGEMTLVGPRPLPLDEVCTGTPAERKRLSIKPGLTCLWQISGRCEIPYREWMLLDLYYIEHKSLLLDLEILVKTVPAVLSRRGAL
jgi:lipopolysaccharide/colanic/teichoic acid biosynthesis glycosyltransferase